MTTWIEDRCPKCRKSNFVNNGDVSDQTVSDVEGIICWNCGHCWVITGLEEELSEVCDVCYVPGKGFMGEK